MRLDQAEGLRLAAEFLAKDAASWSSSAIRTAPEQAFTDGDTLIVPYNTVDFLDRGMESANLVGNMPVSVDLRTGECDFIGFESVLDYVDRGLIS